MACPSEKAGLLGCNPARGFPGRAVLSEDQPLFAGSLSFGEGRIKGEFMATDSVQFSRTLDIFSRSVVFQGVSKSELQDIAGQTSWEQVAKGEYVFKAGTPCTTFHLVLKGLIKTSVSSISGTKITYLLSGPGEPLNLIGPFTGKPRLLEAQAIQNSVVGSIPRQEFMAFVLDHTQVITNVINTLGLAIDSANNRVIDLLEKKVDQRLYKVLYTLYLKFGPRLNFTSKELADLGGTTVESTLRSMHTLRKLGLIQTRRGHIHILKPEELKRYEDDVLWV
ncbi:MAG: Crp/Fnr family transcriptional regulator [Desulfovermiculus sp.]|nr:Crp/Fnr family transcriptional regulator [Desulfovermiculus sp.]